MGVSFLFTSMNSVLCACYGVTLEDKYRLMTNLGLPIFALSLVMAIFFKPKRSDVGYKQIFYFHIFSGPILSEVSLAFGYFRLGLTTKMFAALFRIPIYMLLVKLAWKLRASAGKLQAQELSDFLCQTVLVKGTAAMGTMLFFSFEGISCFISQGSLDNG